MAELIEIGRSWFMILGERYGVNPIIFGGIYLGTIPLFTISVAWLVRNLRREQPILMPCISTIFFFISAYLYLLVDGDNLPTWIYYTIIATVAGCCWSTWKKVRAKMNKR